jgi:hypothetical protein
METLVYAVEAGSARPLAVRESVPPVLLKPRLLDRVREALRVRHYSRRTEEAYVAWIRRYIFFHGKRHPGELGGPDVTRFLSALAVEGHVAASTQNQALSALPFLYRDVLGVELPWLDDIVRAKRPECLPVVLSRDEVRALIQRLDGAPRLMASLVYGAGLRVMECRRLRVQDVERSPKSERDRGVGICCAVPQHPPTYAAGYAVLSTSSCVAGMSDGWWLTPSGNDGPLVAVSGHSGRTLDGNDAQAYRFRGTRNTRNI